MHISLNWDIEHLWILEFNFSHILILLFCVSCHWSKIVGVNFLLKISTLSCCSFRRKIVNIFMEVSRMVCTCVDLGWIILCRGWCYTDLLCSTNGGTVYTKSYTFYCGEVRSTFEWHCFFFWRTIIGFVFFWWERPSLAFYDILGCCYMYSTLGIRISMTIDSIHSVVLLNR